MVILIGLFGGWWNLLTAFTFLPKTVFWVLDYACMPYLIPLPHPLCLCLACPRAFEPTSSASYLALPSPRWWMIALVMDGWVVMCWWLRRLRAFVLTLLFITFPFPSLRLAAPQPSRPFPCLPVPLVVVLIRPSAFALPAPSPPLPCPD